MMTIKSIFIFSLLAISLHVYASDSPWLTDFEQAKKVAKEKNLPILVDFSGSDWCGWCIKLDKEVFSQEKFKDFAKDNFVMLLIDFPKSKKMDQSTLEKNRKLAQLFEVEGFPTVLILDSEGKLIKRTGYMEGGVDKYIEHLKEITKEIKK